ncbi:MAG: hydrogenase nickel incorporation protein HypB [Dehalococcoidia bacterium]|nr:hydrogenase nickel incorporation protein HypB [Dehalococcoidia bacterium]
MEIKVLKDILSTNDEMAERNRALLDSKKITAFNIMSSPGSGKTSLILETIRALKKQARIGVIEGDIASTIDAQKVSREGVPVVQINTGGECHLEAGQIGRALESLPLDEIDLLLIENVGNLVCPGEFRLGEHKKVLILSVPEGEDKVHKYPLLFSVADAIVINKMDLLPYARFDVPAFLKAARGLNRKARIFQVSCATGEGIREWTRWVRSAMSRSK